jgi:transcriptional regulator with XRE-family HTH domain
MVENIDRHLGARLRARRNALGLTQAALAALVGATFQQIHKYESGQVRVSAARIWRLAGCLEVGMEYFFEGHDGDQIDFAA